MSGRGVVQSIRGLGLRFTYARLPERSGEQPTRTPRGQIGVAFTAHPRLVCDVDGKTRRVDVAAGATYLTSEAPIDWCEVHGPTEAIEIHIDASLLAAAGALHTPSAFAVRDAVVFVAASRLRASYLRYGAIEDVFSSTIAHRLASHIAYRYAATPTRASRSPRLGWREVEVVHRFTRERLATTLTLDDLAQQVHRSVYDFARLFKDTTGMPPHRFVTTMRMHHALEQLRHGATVTAAAAAVGYSSRDHFRQQFRAAIGADPGHVMRLIAQERGHLAAQPTTMLEA